MLLRRRKVSGGNEFEINQLTVSQGLGNTFQGGETGEIIQKAYFEHH